MPRNPLLTICIINLAVSDDSGRLIRPLPMAIIIDYSMQVCIAIVATLYATLQLSFAVLAFQRENTLEPDVLQRNRFLAQQATIMTSVCRLYAHAKENC